MENEDESDQLRDELNACQHFSTDTEMENGCPDSMIKGMSRFSDSRTTSEKSSSKLFDFGSNTKKPYNDYLCLFQALAVHLQKIIYLETSTSKFF